MVEPTGYTALDLIGFTDKGPYDPTANYVKNDLVHVGNSTWRCKIDDTTGITPTEGANWTIFIESATSLAGMSDVDLNTPKAGDGLVHDGNKWINIPITTKEQWKKNGAYNLLPMTYTNHVISGATAIVNADGSVTIDTAGSATTGVANFVWDVPLLGKVGEKYKLVGCPSGGGANTYYVNIYDNGWSDNTKDYGSGKEITIGTGITQAVISIRSGVTIDHLTFKPMLTTDLNATYADYVPYAMTNRELTEEVQSKNVSFLPETSEGMIGRSNRRGNVYRVGNTVFLEGGFVLAQGFNDNTEFTSDVIPAIGIPQRPSDGYQIVVTFFNASKGKAFFGRLLNNGTIIIRNNSGVNFSADDYIVFNVTYAYKI